MLFISQIGLQSSLLVLIGQNLMGGISYRALALLFIGITLGIEANPTQEWIPATEVDLAVPFSCTSNFASAAERVHFKQWQDTEARVIVTESSIEAEGTKTRKAYCWFTQTSYRCRWGLNSYVEIDLSRPVVHRLEQNLLDYVLEGTAKIGVFGKVQPVHCRFQLSYQEEPIPQASDVEAQAITL